MNFRILSDHYHAKIIERKKIATLSLVIHFLLQYSKGKSSRSLFLLHNFSSPVSTISNSFGNGEIIYAISLACARR